ncbi:hypothetical protein KFE25_002969 [Diacronema lutheri]|mgnify:CR=1 FL=1|uniref:ATP-dependent (S)-NAD(P)H-hydrate dehydratase n=1 Tax=Diacronema lutheri TaxID=2081491 RepID=A0A8J5XP95_DIALT|nr:hypothetical protein KFE25_002969 [Diacronema lutheri]
MRRSTTWAAFLLAHARQALSTLVPGLTDRSLVLERALHALVPPLSGSRYKGQSGRVGVVGGSFEYTGAPFYAAISALKVGADLSHIFCDVAAGTAIKSYSPEIIVHPVLRGGAHPPQEVQTGACADGASDEDVARASADGVIKWFRALDALIVGPGLSRDPALLAASAHVLRAAAAHGLPTVIDADGLRIVMDEPGVLRGERAVFVLTPNRAELARLYDKLVPAASRLADAEDASTSAVECRARQICESLGSSVVLVAKGGTDVLHDGESALLVSEPGAPKRSGGQGDVLSGAIATWLAWAHADGVATIAREAGVKPAALAAYGACLLTRRFAREAYRAHKRSMTAPDVIDAIGAAFDAWHPAPEVERALVGATA